MQNSSFSAEHDLVDASGENAQIVTFWDGATNLIKYFFLSKYKRPKKIIVVQNDITELGQNHRYSVFPDKCRGK